MVEMKPGLELDKAVAEAIGRGLRLCEWEPTGLAGYENAVYRCKECGDLCLSDTGDGDNQECVPPYSTDLNAAFAAAEKVGLFLELTHLSPECWSASARILRDWCATADTPAEAICAAILKLKD